MQVSTKLGGARSGASATHIPPSYPAGVCYHFKPFTRHTGPGRSCRVSWASNSQSVNNTQPFSLSTSFASPSKQVVPAHADADEPSTNVSFWLKLQTNWGEGVKLIGSHPKLGSWALDKAVELHWEGNLWTATVSLPAGAVYEYKYCVIDFGTKKPVSWQQGGNAVLAVDMGEANLDVHDNWANDPGAEVRSEGFAITRENKLQKWAGTLVTQYKSVVQERQQLVQWAQEGQAIKGELARVKMELSLMQQAQRESDVQVAALKEQNMCLQQDLLHARQELNASFTEALKLLTEDAWDAPDETQPLADDYDSEGDVNSTEVGAAGEEAGAAGTDNEAASESEKQGYGKWLNMNNISSTDGRMHGSGGNSQGVTSQAAVSRS